MKTRVGLLVVVALATGCPDPNGTGSTSSSSSGAATGTADAGTPDAGGRAVDAGPPVRTVTEHTSLFGNTAVRNLLMDPLFKDMFSGSSFLPLIISDQGVDYAFPAAFERATPSNTAGMLAEVPEPGWRLALVAPFNGGTGPFHSDVWISPRADGAEEAIPASAVAVQIGEAWLDSDPGQAVFDLQYVPADDKTMDGAIWYHFVATVTGPLPSTCVMVIAAQQENIHLAVAGPQVVPQSLRVNALGNGAGITPFPGIPSSWQARDLPLLEFARKHGPHLAPPPRLRGLRR